MRHFEVVLTSDAVRDIAEIHGYIKSVDGAAKADHVLERIEAVVESLATAPERGSFPPELLRLGVREYRQAFFKPYRVIYRVAATVVYVYLIADGRRDLQAQLARRLLGG